jgi:hypothetical protein
MLGFHPSRKDSHVDHDRDVPRRQARGRRVRRLHRPHRPAPAGRRRGLGAAAVRSLPRLDRHQETPRISTDSLASDARRTRHEQHRIGKLLLEIRLPVREAPGRGYSGTSSARSKAHLNPPTFEIRTIHRGLERQQPKRPWHEYRRARHRRWRPAIADIHDRCDALVAHGWRRVEITAQVTEGGESLPIHAYFNAPSVDRVLIGGIHGREPAGAAALAHFAGRLPELARGQGILLLPLLNPWGYSRHVRYGSSGQSVSDSDHLLGRSSAPACREAAAITAFVLDAVRINPRAAVLDLHEDPVYEAPDYHLEGSGSYLYVSGDGGLQHPVTRRVHRCLEASSLPLVMEGVTRFGERLVDGVIVDAEDGSIDELLARKRACSPVITAEIVLRSETTPPLAERVSTYLDVLDAFFGS